MQLKDIKHWRRGSGEECQKYLRQSTKRLSTVTGRKTKNIDDNTEAKTEKWLRHVLHHD